MPTAAKILYIEDNPGDYELFSEMLEQGSEGEVSVSGTPRLSEALKRLDEDTFSAVLLDLNLLDISGIQSVRILHESYPHLPIIVFTGMAEAEAEQGAFASGAQEYLVKGKQSSEQLLHSIAQSIRRKKMEAEFFFRSNYDTLTHLPNILLLEEHLRQAFARTRRYENRPALMLIEIQNYTTITHTFGHEQTALLLSSFATSVKHMLRDSDLLARWDEGCFALLMDDTKSKEHCYRAARRIGVMLQQPILLAGGKIHVDISIGAALFSPRYTHHGELVIAAKGALYEAREHCGGLYIHDPVTDE